jgi:hypothetical protein
MESGVHARSPFATTEVEDRDDDDEKEEYKSGKSVRGVGVKERRVEFVRQA